MPRVCKPTPVFPDRFSNQLPQLHLTTLTSPIDTQVSVSAVSDTPSNSLASLLTAESTKTSVTSPQMSPPLPATHLPQDLHDSPKPSPSVSVHVPGPVATGLKQERPSFLDESALSPHEFDVYTRWASRIKPAHSRRHGLLDEHAAVKFLRNELGVSVDDEINVCILLPIPAC